LWSDLEDKKLNAVSKFCDFGTNVFKVAASIFFRWGQRNVAVSVSYRKLNKIMKWLIAKNLKTY